MNDRKAAIGWQPSLARAMMTIGTVANGFTVAFHITDFDCKNIILNTGGRAAWRDHSPAALFFAAISNA